MTAPDHPWAAGAPPLNAVRSRPRSRSRFGWVPTRRQILAGYTDPDDGRYLEGQVERAIGEIHATGSDPTVENIALRLAIAPGDREFLAVLGVEDPDDGIDGLSLADGLRFARRWAQHARTLDPPVIEAPEEPDQLELLELLDPDE